MLPNVMQLVLQLIWQILGDKSFDAWLARGDKWWLANVSTWAGVKGRVKSRGFSGVLRRRKAGSPPTIRSKSRYDIVHAFKGFAVLVHETLLEIGRDSTTKRTANAAHLAIEAIQLVADVGHLLTLKMPSSSDKQTLCEKNNKLMPILRTAFRGLKDFN